MRNETLKNLLLTASLISASALLTACGDNAKDPAKPAKPAVNPAISDAENEKLAAAEAARKAALEKVASLEAEMQGLGDQQRAAAENALAARQKENQEQMRVLKEDYDQRLDNLNKRAFGAMQAAKSAGSLEGKDALTSAYSDGLDAFNADMKKQREILIATYHTYMSSANELMLLKDYALLPVKSVAEFEAQLATRAEKKAALTAEAKKLSETATAAIRTYSDESLKHLVNFTKFIEEQRIAFGRAGTTVTAPLSNTHQEQTSEVASLGDDLRTDVTKKSEDVSIIVKGLEKESETRANMIASFNRDLTNDAKISKSLRHSLMGSPYEIVPQSNYDAAFKVFLESHKDALKNGTMSSDAFLEDFLTGDVANNYALTLKLKSDYPFSKAQMDSGKFTEITDQNDAIMYYQTSRLTLKELATFLETAARFDDVKNEIKQLMALRLKSSFSYFFSDTAPKYFKKLAARLKDSLPFPEVDIPASDEFSRQLSAGTLGDISGNISLRQARTSATGSADLRAFNVNGASGESIALGMPLFVQLKGDVSSSKATEAATGSVAYRLGNTVIGAIQGYANSGDGFGIEGRQFETSVVASHSFGSFFIEGQLGTVSATDVHFSNWKGMRSQVTLGLDTEFVSPFVQITHRQLDRSGLDLNQTTGFVGLDMDIAKLKADSYSVDARLTAKVGYGEKAWSIKAIDLGTTTGFSGSVEWAGSLNLNSGVKFTTNLGLDTVAGSSAAVTVSLDR